MQAGHKNTYDSIAAFSATDFRADLQSGLPSLGRPRLLACLTGPSARNALYASWRVHARQRYGAFVSAIAKGLHGSQLLAL